MGGGAMHVELPKIQFNSSSSNLPLVPSSSGSLNLPVRINSAPLRSCPNEICRRPESLSLDGQGDKRTGGSVNNSVFGPVPSRLEVENAVTALWNFMHGISSSRQELKWLQPVLDCCHPSVLQAQGRGSVYDAFRLLLAEPSVKRLVVSLSSDKALWDAVMNNELVRKLCASPNAVEKGRPQEIDEEADLSIGILKWMLDIAKERVTELVLKFQSLVNEVFQTPRRREKPGEETVNQLDEKVRSSLVLSIVILLIVIVARLQRA